MVSVQANPEEQEGEREVHASRKSSNEGPGSRDPGGSGDEFGAPVSWLSREDSHPESEDSESSQVEDFLERDAPNENALENSADSADDEESSDGWKRKKVVTTCFEDRPDGSDRTIQQVVPNLDETTIGDVNITNSNHVHIGNTNFYKGPVTIKQFVYTNSYPGQIKDDIDEKNGGRSSNVTQNNFKQDIPMGPWGKMKKRAFSLRYLISCALLLILIPIVAGVSIVLFKQSSTTGGIPVIPTSGTNDSLVDGVRFVERNEWLAQPPETTLNNLTETPVPFVIISHTASDQCFTQSECVLRVRLIQTYHIESKGWDDIAYNFLVGGDGLAYVGRGWDSEGAHSYGYNRRSIGISFIGTFNDIEPRVKQLHAALKVIEVGLRLGKISSEYKLLGHRQVSATLSPGNKLYEIIKTWSHWSPIPEPNSAVTRTASTAILPLILALYVLNYR